MKIVAVVQARMGSQRLPGKVMTRLKGVPAIGWVATAASRAVGVDEVVVATSTNSENDVIERWCRINGIECYRGSEDDVLDRYIGVVDKYNADAIVRLTADCPLHDYRVIGDVIAAFKATGCDYACNTEPPTYPDGLDTEVISARALKAAHQEAVRKSDRDTVTRFIVRNRSRFPAENVIAPVNMVKERWVMDSPEDLSFIQAVLSHTHDRWTPSYQSILEILRAHPEIRLLNAKYSRNERFFEGLQGDFHGPRSFARSSAALERSEKTIPLGAQTFSKSKLVFPHGASPLFLSHGDGGYCFDVDGNDYVDLVSALLPNVLGYRDSDVDYAVRRQLDSGISLSLATELEARVSEKLVHHIPCAEMVRFGKNGSDVTSAAVRLARAFTGRDKLMVVGYHGWHDWAQSNLWKGVPSQVLALTQTIPDNLETSTEYAAVVIEPEYFTKEQLQQLRSTCDKNGTLLIFDEVITGFRWDLGGIQKRVGVTPDLACFGKAMANGMPLSAVVGRRDIMMKMAPPDNIFYSGTFFGETLSLAACLSTIEKMEREPVIAKLWDTGEAMRAAAQKEIDATGMSDAVKLSGEAPLVRLSFRDNDIKSMFIQEMAQNGVLIIASHNVCYAHGENEVRLVGQAYKNTMEKIAHACKSGDIKKYLIAGTIQSQGVR